MFSNYGDFSVIMYMISAMVVIVGFVFSFAHRTTYGETSWPPIIIGGSITTLMIFAGLFFNAPEDYRALGRLDYRYVNEKFVDGKLVGGSGGFISDEHGILVTPGCQVYKGNFALDVNMRHSCGLYKHIEKKVNSTVDASYSDVSNAVASLTPSEPVAPVNKPLNPDQEIYEVDGI